MASDSRGGALMLIDAKTFEGTVIEIKDHWESVRWIPTVIFAPQSGHWLYYISIDYINYPNSREIRDG
jgi:hypothetical protein